MNLRTSQLYLSFFFLLALFSCEKPTDIGLGLPGQNELGTHFEQQAGTTSTVIHPDSILAFKNDPIAVGKFSDGLLGTISATHYTEIGLNGTNVSFKPAANANASLTLTLAYNGFYYGDTTATIKLNVYKLSQNFEDAKVYYTTDKIPTEPTVLGSITFKPQFNREGKESRLINIPLDKAFADELLTKTFPTQTEFRAYWKGIAIAPDPSSAPGSIVGFTTFPDTAGTIQAKVAGINLDYTDNTGKNQRHNFSFSGAYYFNGTEITRQAPFATLNKGQEIPSSSTNGVTYIQANTGVKTRVVFPGLQNFKATNGNVYVNHAELVVPVKKGSFVAKNPITPPPARIFVYESTPGNRIPKTSGGTAIWVQSGTASAFGLNSPALGLYNSDSLYYKVNITSYVQALIDKRKENNGLIITPSPEDIAAATGTNLTFPGTLNLNRALIDATDKKVVLRIYYSKLQ